MIGNEYITVKFVENQVEVYNRARSCNGKSQVPYTITVHFPTQDVDCWYYPDELTFYWGVDKLGLWYYPDQLTLYWGVDKLGLWYYTDELTFYWGVDKLGLWYYPDELTLYWGVDKLGSVWKGRCKGKNDNDMLHYIIDDITVSQSTTSYI